MFFAYKYDSTDSRICQVYCATNTCGTSLYFVNVRLIINHVVKNYANLLSISVITVLDTFFISIVEFGIKSVPMFLCNNWNGFSHNQAGRIEKEPQNLRTHSKVS